MIQPAQLQQAWHAVQKEWPDLHPKRALICGSGWGEALRELNILGELAYADLPGLGATAVAGHAGKLLYAEVDSQRCLIFLGRRHLYEGLGWTPIALPIYVAKQAGVREILLTNAAGAILKGVQPGEFMLISDHINLMGDNPLCGPHLPEWGDRFPDQSQVYCPRLRTALHSLAAEQGLHLHEGVYAATRGPLYETPAEIRAWKSLGADAVGMSTVPEAQLASAAGLRVAGLSCLTNLAAGLGQESLSHEEVQRNAEAVLPSMRRLLTKWLGQPS